MYLFCDMDKQETIKEVKTIKEGSVYWKGDTQVNRRGTLEKVLHDNPDKNIAVWSTTRKAWFKIENWKGSYSLALV